MAEEVDQVLGQQRVDGEAGGIQVDQHHHQDGGAGHQPEDVDHRHHARRDHGGWRCVAVVAAEQLRPAHHAAEAAVTCHQRAPDVQVQQQKSHAQHQQSGQEQRGRPGAPHAHRLAGQRVQEGPGAVKAPDQHAAQQHRHAHQEQPQVGLEDALGQLDVLAEEVPHDGRAGDGRDPNHADAVQRHQLVEPHRPERQDLRLLGPHQEPEHHHQQQHGHSHHQLRHHPRVGAAINLGNGLLRHVLSPCASLSGLPRESRWSCRGARCRSTPCTVPCSCRPCRRCGA